MNSFYRTVLSHHFGSEENHIVTHVRLILGIVISLETRVQLKALVPFISSLYELPNIETTQLRPIRRLIRILESTNRTETPYTALQPPFLAFLADSSQSGPYSITLRAAHEEMSLVCLRIMSAELRFNICDLPSSFLLNKNVDLSRRIESNISCDGLGKNIHKSTGAMNALCNLTALILELGYGLLYQ